MVSEGTQMPDLSHAPWSDEQLQSIKEFQNRRDMPRLFHRAHGDGDGLLLTGSRDYLSCVRCGHRQDWVPASVADGSWRNMPDVVTYLLPCAAMPRGCTSVITHNGPHGIDWLNLDPEVPEDAAALKLINDSGWRLDHGKWICGNHDQATDTIAVGLDDGLDDGLDAPIRGAIAYEQDVTLRRALTAVLDRHPVTMEHFREATCSTCGDREHKIPWPCPDVAVIARVLRIEVYG